MTAGLLVQIGPARAGKHDVGKTCSLVQLPLYI